MSCPFVSKDILSRLPEDKKAELEKYYTDMVKQKNGGLEVSNSKVCPLSMIDEE
jgi:hypothetical protein